MTTPQGMTPREYLASIAGHNEETVARYNEIVGRTGSGVPGAWTHAELERGFAIFEAEDARQATRAAIVAEVVAAYARFPRAATAGEACQLARLDLAAIDRRLRDIPPPDDLGLQWLIAEYRRAEADGSLSSP